MKKDEFAIKLKELLEPVVLTNIEYEYTIVSEIEHINEMTEEDMMRTSVRITMVTLLKK